MWFFFSFFERSNEPRKDLRRAHRLEGQRKAPARFGRPVPSLGVAHSHWPVVAWIRLKLPERPPPMTLMPGIAPPPDPPLDILAPNPVPTDPRKRVYSFELERDDWVVRLVWDADDPELLEAECRAPLYGQRLPAGEVPKFWATVKELVAPLGPLPVEAADPRPPGAP